MIIKAEEHFEAKRYYNQWMDELVDYQKELVIDMIKEAQSDAIEQCAENAALEYRTYAKYRGGCSIEKDIPEEYEVGVNQFIAINKQSILDLINQIK